MVSTLVIVACFLSIVITYLYGLPAFLVMCKYMWEFLVDSSKFIFEKMKFLISKLSDIARDNQK